MPMRFDPMAARFAQQQQPLLSWEKSSKTFDFDEGFVKWIQKYLKNYSQPNEVVHAKAWISKAQFTQERYELCELQWEAYQESLKQPTPQPTPQPAVVNRPVVVPAGGSRVVNDAPVVSDSQPTVIEPEPVPVDPETVRLEGETDGEYRLRMIRMMREKMQKIGEWKK